MPPGSSDLDPRHFDVVIVDEFHHAAAPSYRALARSRAPRRAAGADRHAGAQRRPAACSTGSTTGSPPSCACGTPSTSTGSSPFAYYGDPRRPRSARDPLAARPGLRRRRPVEPAHRERRLGAARREGGGPPRRRSRANAGARLLRERRARAVHGARLPRRGHPSDRGLGRQPDEERRARLQDLAARRVNVVFSVDLFNEGVDVPAVDTLLMLRPTDSPTLFLQQLGRGLRRAPARRAARSSTSSVTIAPSSASTDAFARCSEAAGASSRRRSSRASRSCRRAATWSSTGSRARSCSRASASAVPSRWTAKVEELRSIAQGRRRVSRSATSSSEAGSSSRTSTRATRSLVGPA